MAYGFVASGDINPSRFVAGIDSEPFYVEQATASKRIIGVSQRGTRYAPGTAADDGTAATTGQELRVHQEGEEALVKCGGTITAFELLTADASGQAVEVGSSTALQYVGGIALQDGASGEIIRIKVKTFELINA